MNTKFRTQSIIYFFSLSWFFTSEIEVDKTVLTQGWFAFRQRTWVCFCFKDELSSSTSKSTWLNVICIFSSSSGNSSFPRWRPRDAFKNSTTSHTHTGCFVWHLNTCIMQACVNSLCLWMQVWRSHAVTVWKGWIKKMLGLNRSTTRMTPRQSGTASVSFLYIPVKTYSTVYKTLLLHWALGVAWIVVLVLTYMQHCHVSPQDQPAHRSSRQETSREHSNRKTLLPPPSPPPPPSLWCGSV